MNVFTIVAASQSTVEPLKQAVESGFPGEHLRVGDTCWLVAEATFEVAVIAKKLGVKDQTSGTLTDVLIIWTVLYWGSLNPQVWAWISQKIQQPIVQNPK
jgi:hypothetical protein